VRVVQLQRKLQMRACTAPMSAQWEPGEGMYSQNHGMAGRTERKGVCILRCGMV